MTIRSRDEFQELINSKLPNNSSKQITPEDLRLVFSDLADSVGNLQAETNIVSLNFATPDTRSTLAGETALEQLSLANRSTEDSSAFGYGSLRFIYTGVRNTAVGSKSLSFLSLGNDNTAVGVDTLCAVTAGSGNLGLGNYALQKNKRGNFNIAVGYGAGHYIDDNSNFKFYLGSFPEASGDCDITYEDGKPPLLYGDLQKNQLGVGVRSFHNDSTALQVSGNVLPHESGGVFSLGSGEYRWDAYLNNVFISGSLDYPLAWDFNITDGEASPSLVASGDIIHVSGVSGIKTELLDEGDNKYLFVSAAPLSGWASTELYGISGADGLLHDISGYPNGYVYQVSGWAYTELNEISGVGKQIDTVSGWALGSLTEISGVDGLLYSASGSLAHEINEVSGVGGQLDTVSGWALGSLNLLSGISDPLWEGLPSGLIWQVSGWSRDYTNATAIDAGAFSFWELEGQYGASGIINHADTVIISGCSGVETILDFNENGVTNNYRLNINAAPVSGWAEAYTDLRESVLQSQITANSNDITTIEDTSLPNISGYPNGLLYLASGSLASEINDVSGVDGQIDNVSGWAYENLNLLSGIHEGPLWGGRPSGLIFQVSGWAKDYADAIDVAGGGYNHWKVSTLDPYTDGRTTENVSTTDEVLFSGVEGITVDGTLDGSTKVVKIDGTHISGIIVQEVNRIDTSITSINGEIDGIDTSISTLTTNLTNTGVNLLKELDLVSGVNGTLNSASGDLHDQIQALSGYLSDSPEGLIYLVSGWNKKYTEDQTDFTIGADGYGYWRAYDESETNYQIASTDKIKFVGDYGVDTNIRKVADVVYLDISTEPLSGIFNELSGIYHGVIDTRIREAGGAGGTFYTWTLSDSVRTSTIQGTDQAKFVGVSGIETYLNASDDRMLISAGPLEARIDKLDNDLSCIKGVNCPETNAECCDNISGWALTNFEILSGVSPTIYGNSGLIWSVSGWNKGYTDDQIQGITLSSDSYSSWRISDGTTTRNIRALEETQFLGVSGLTTQTKTDGASGLYISAGPLSGWINFNLYEEAGQVRVRQKQAEGYAATISGNLANSINQVSGYPDGLLYQVSGWTAGELNSISGVGGQIDLVSGWSLENLTQISGFNGIIDQVSGWTEYNLDAISGVDGIIDQDVLELSGALNSELNLLSGVADNLWNGDPSGLIWQVSGIFNTISALNFTAGSGLILENDEFRTYGSGNFDKVILNRRDDNNDPSGQVVADTGSYHDIVNASGFLITPHYEKLSDLKTNLPADASNSGAIVFAGDMPYRSNNGHWSRPVFIEGFLQDDILTAASYNSPTSGRLVTMNDSFESSETVWITNRDTYLEISGTLFCVASLVNNEYRPIYYSCSGV